MAPALHFVSSLLLLGFSLGATAAPFDDRPAAPPNAQGPAPTAFAAKEPLTKQVSWGTGSGKSYWIPAGEILGFQFVLNRFDYPSDHATYGVTLNSVRDNLKHRWVVDNDPFAINQFLHPYAGSMYHNFARSTGLNFWEASGYAFAGSIVWEYAGETTKPSINDQIATGIGGNFLGEPLFRMASLLLETGRGKPGFWRELGAAFIAPSLGTTRLAYDRFDGVFPSHQPAVYTRVQLGTSITETASGRGVEQQLKRFEPSADFTMDYGLPGKPGYTYDRPFDYFAFQFTAAPSNVFENILVRGLLYGSQYSAGDNYRGIWGLFGSYDYISPQIFRVSSTAASLGTTGQYWLGKSIALQGTAMAGIGYGAAGTNHRTDNQDYHYGLTPQELLTFRVIIGSRVLWDITARDYYVSRVASTESRGSENIIRGDTSLTLRVYGLHGITLKYAASARDARFPDLPDLHQRVGTVSLSYTYLSHTRFGVVDWRPSADEKPPDKM